MLQTRRPAAAILRADLADEPWLPRPAVPDGLGIHNDGLGVGLVIPVVRTRLGPSCETQVSMTLEGHPVVADAEAAASYDEIDRNTRGVLVVP